MGDYFELINYYHTRTATTTIISDITIIITYLTNINFNWVINLGRNFGCGDCFVVTNYYYYNTIIDCYYYMYYYYYFSIRNYC